MPPPLTHKRARCFEIIDCFNIHRSAQGERERLVVLLLFWVNGVARHATKAEEHKLLSPHQCGILERRKTSFFSLSLSARASKGISHFQNARVRERE